MASAGVMSISFFTLIDAGVGAGAGQRIQLKRFEIILQTDVVAVKCSCISANAAIRPAGE